jgi:hypothetical protein
MYLRKRSEMVTSRRKSIRLRLTLSPAQTQRLNPGKIRSVVMHRPGLLAETCNGLRMSNPKRVLKKVYR